MKSDKIVRLEVQEYEAKVIVEALSQMQQQAESARQYAIGDQQKARWDAFREMLANLTLHIMTNMLLNPPTNSVHLIVSRETCDEIGFALINRRNYWRDRTISEQAKGDSILAGHAGEMYKITDRAITEWEKETAENWTAMWSEEIDHEL